MQRREMIGILAEEDVCWIGNRGLFWDKYDYWKEVSVQLTPVGINFYKYHDGKWQRYERLLFDKCEVDMNYPDYICNHTKQERSRTLKEILENRG